MIVEEQPMIDIGKILKRSWHILWNYKVLWIFGFLLALTIGNSGGNSGSSYQFSQSDTNNYNPNNYQTGPYWNEFNSWMQKNVEPILVHPERYISTFIWIGVIFLTIILIFGAINALIRYPTETAVFRMVDGYEQTGAKVGFRQGWKLGWSRRAFRIWLVDLVLNIPAFVFTLLLLGTGVIFFYNMIAGYEQAALVSLFGGLFCIIIPLALIIVVLMVFLSVLRQFIARKVALEDMTFGEAFRSGWTMFKHNLGGAALMWLVMLGIGIGVGIAMVIAMIAGVIVAAIPGLAAFGIASIFGGKILAIIIGFLVAMPFFAIVLGSPALFLSGWIHIYSSSVWTLTYREMKARETVQPVETAPLVQPS
jgi:hypothetical protein